MALPNLQFRRLTLPLPAAHSPSPYHYKGNIWGVKEETLNVAELVVGKLKFMLQ